MTYLYLAVFLYFFLGLQRENTKKGGINEEKKIFFFLISLKKLTELLFKKSSFLVSKIERTVKGQDKAKLAT